MIDPVAVSKIEHLIPTHEKVLWAGEPKFNLLSKYNLVYFGCLSTVGLAVFFLHKAGSKFLQPMMDLLRDQHFIAIIFLGYMILVIVWVATKPKFDSFVLTDKALYVRRKSIPFLREARLSHSNIVKVKPVFGLSDTASVSYEPLKDKASLNIAIWDMSTSFLFYNRYILHIRDVPDMDVLLRLLRDKANLRGNQHR